mmetsp:Transcript_144314/g.266082  ORF Transcript_144314/g.266082 Transcript_144314/m.266082 type:complete len:279 (+) Transcript_144314:2-838(+)
MNKMRGTLDVCAIKSPGFGNRKTAYLEDIAIITGATFVTEQLGLTFDSITPEMLGTAQRVSVTKERTTLIATGEHTEKVNERIESIKKELAETDSEFDTEKFEERIARLGGAIGRIKVGAATETELKDKKLRYEDAMNSVKAALQNGILPGGGSTLVYLLRTKDDTMKRIDAEDEDERLAVELLYRAMEAPIKQIGYNCGQEGEVILDNVRDHEFGYGWNAATGEYVDLFEDGVIDSATVTQQAVINSASIASSVITTSALVTELPDEDEKDKSPPKK